MLVATGVLQQVDKNSVAHTPRSLVYASANPLRAMFEMKYVYYFVGGSAWSHKFKIDSLQLRRPVSDDSCHAGIFRYVRAERAYRATKYHLLIRQGPP